MRRGGRILVILGIVLALISGAGVYVVLATAEPEAQPVKTTKVVLAVQDVTERSELIADQLAEADWPVTIPTPIGAFARATEVTGKLAMSPIHPGQPVVEKMLKSKDEVKEAGSNAALVIEKGTVGIAMPVTVNTNVAEAIQAGDHVDIIAQFTAQPVATGNQPQTGPLIATQRLLADVLVLQVGPWPGPQSKGETASPSTVVTFQMKEQDALVLKYALENATAITLALRAANDHEVPDLEPVTFEYINKRFGYNFPATGQ